VIHEEDGLLLFAGAHLHPNPYRNGALRIDDVLPAEEVLHRAGAFFADRGRPYALWVREHADRDLEEAASKSGMRELDRLPELVLDGLPPDLPPPEGVELRQAVDRRTSEDYLRIVAGGWGMGTMPLDIASRVFFDPRSLDAPHAVGFVAYYEGMPLSGAMTLATHGIALGCQAATVRKLKPGQALPPSSRPGERLGLAQSCLRAALEYSFEELGTRRSLCQTSPLGAPVWRELGYGPLTSYARYLATAVRPTVSQSSR
jgi:hypothetical protein